MKSEYLLFNLVVIIGPLLAGFSRRFRTVRLWGFVLAAAAVIAVPFITWDILVSGRHWYFNPAYTVDFRLLGLPPGEWLFFFTVPFACLFIWEILPETSREQSPMNRRNVPYAPSLVWAKHVYWCVPGLLLMALWFYISGKEYTGLVLFSLGIAIAADRWLNTMLLLRAKTWLYCEIVIILTLIFNTYLTARPVVLYGIQYQLDLRIGSIPVEDFAYGIAHLLLCIVVYEKLLEQRTKLHSLR